MGMYSVISESAVIEEGVIIGDFVKIGANAHIESGVVLGDYVTIGDDAKLGKNTKVSSYTNIGARVTVGENGSFTRYCEIRDDCQLGRNVVMGSRGTLSAGTIVEDDVIMKYAFVVTDTPNLNDNDTKLVGRLKKGSKYGASVVIMPGVEVGEDAEIGACSLVRHNVPKNEIWYGMPARKYK